MFQVCAAAGSPARLRTAALSSLRERGGRGAPFRPALSPSIPVTGVSSCSARREECAPRTGPGRHRGYLSAVNILLSTFLSGHIFKTVGYFSAFIYRPKVP